MRKADGFALIDVLFVCGMIGILSLLAMPRLLTARQAASSSSALSSLRTINSAELTFALTCGGGFYAPNLSTLGTPPPNSKEPYISGGLGISDTVTKSGYIMRVAVMPYAGAPPTCNGLGSGATGQGFIAAADPTEPGNSHFFGTNATNQIYEHTATLYPEMAEAGPPNVGKMLVR